MALTLNEVYMPPSLRLCNQRRILGSNRPETPLLVRVDVPPNALVLPDRGDSPHRLLGRGSLFPAAGPEKRASARGFRVDG